MTKTPLLPFLALLGSLSLQADDHVAVGSGGAVAAGQPAGGGEENLAKQSQNPVGDLISVPFENNFYFGIGPSDSTLYAMIAKPVYPVKLGDINLINRFIIPVLYAEGQNKSDLQDAAGLDDDEAADIGFGSSVRPFTGSEFGLGDITYQGFFTPASPGSVIWGIGPNVTLPTHTADRFGTNKWSGGPAAVVLAMPGKWVIGALLSQSWSFAGPDGDSDVNKTVFQPFVNYNFGEGWYFNTSPIISANWENNDDTFTIPVGGGIGKLHRFGNQPVDFRLAGYYFAEAPDAAPDWQLQFTIKFLFPK